jgi:hypothetical protein
MGALSHVLGGAYEERDDHIKKYLESKVVYLCDCGKGRKIKNHSSIREVDAKDGMCIYCRHAALSKRVPQDWVPGMGLFKLRRKADEE